MLYTPREHNSTFAMTAPLLLAPFPFLRSNLLCAHYMLPGARAARRLCIIVTGTHCHVSIYITKYEHIIRPLLCCGYRQFDIDFDSISLNQTWTIIIFNCGGFTCRPTTLKTVTQHLTIAFVHSIQL